MKFGDHATFEITDIDRKGRGCGLVNERPACAYFTLPGEEIEGVLVKRQQGVKRFQIARVTKPSPHRTTPRCAFAGKCGGCVWQQFDYGYQLEMKRRLVNRSLVSAGLGGLIIEVIPCPVLYGFRNRMDYCVGWRGEVGLKEPGRWNSYLDLTECHLLSPDATKAVAVFRDWMRDNKIEPWDGVKYTGYARYIVIREGKNTGERLIMVVTSVGPLPAEKELIAALSPFATTLIHGINPTITDLSVAAEMRVLKGEPFLREAVGGKTFIIPPNSFFQTNTIMAGKMLEVVKQLVCGAGVNPAAMILDLYCGVGFFGIGLADLAERVVGVELDAAAIEVAEKNAELNGVRNAEFHAAAAESLSWENEKPDVVVVDPPRSGLHPKVARLLVEKKPERIIYVSCNHDSFARDWKILGEAYQLKQATALDLFPHGPHVELVTLLELK
ncbi:MAG: 23S rRNA (uracil(1939)-C(5))-methyltransferase RlmD [Patescibacteria group bacterium]|nr:23S rRNA (uracil(1939)-C(5))-methyltransferase RlmD [Patescibacteria group bacterium]